MSGVEPGSLKNKLLLNKSTNIGVSESMVVAFGILAATVEVCTVLPKILSIKERPA